MAKSIADSNKSRGRPATGIGKAIGLRLYPELEAGLAAYEKAQEKRPSRPEAIRQILTQYLKSRGFISKK
jgi:hypothetical protein